MSIYYFFLYLIFFQNLVLFRCQENNKLEKNQSQINQLINPLAYYRIDTLNGCSITIKDEKVKLKHHKIGDSQNFIFINIDSNSYYIESRFNDRRIGINDKNELVTYDNDDDKNKDKMTWNIQLYESDDNINNNKFLIQNKYNLNFLEIKEINETYSVLNCESKNTEKSQNKNSVFIFIKIFEICKIKPEHLEIIENEPIDIVIKYIDLTDKNLVREGIKQVKKDEDNEELKFSVRSIFKYVPWVRKIFIIMPNEKVRFFKPYEEIKDKFVYVKDKDLIGFDTSNSAIFQFNLFRLKNYGLSENFIYMDDDYFFGKSLKKTDFFYYDEELKKVVPFIITNDLKEIDYNETIREYNQLFEMRKSLDPHKYMGWRLSILASEKLLFENYNIRPMITTFFTHVAIPVNIHDIEECYDLILRRYKYIEETLYSIERHILILQSEHLFVLYGLNVKKRKVHFIWFNFITINYVKDEYLHAPLYVINNNGDDHYTEEDFKKAKAVLENRYPERIQYELPFDIPKEKDEIKINEENKTVNEEQNKTYKEEDDIKKDEKIDYNLTINEFYMEHINVQKKKELVIKYKKKIKDYKNSIWKLFIIFIAVAVLLLIIILFSKIKKNKTLKKYKQLNTF